MENTDYTQEIAKRLKEARIHRKISQEKMAILMDITHSTYVKIENCHQNLTMKNLIKACKVLDVSADMLLFGKLHNEETFNFDDYITYSKVFKKEDLENVDKIIQSLMKLKIEKKSKQHKV